MMNLSVIIPHYKSVDLLKRALDSIPRSNDIEVIVVDDNSPLSDEQEEKLKSLGDNNVTIIFNKDSKGAGHARNVGLKKAQGKWIVFSDADDFFTKEAFEIFKSHYSDQADIIYFLSDHIYSDTFQLFDNNCMGLNDKVIAYDGSKEKEGIMKYGICVPWGRMFRSSLIKDNNIVFDEVRYANDTMFSVRTAYFAKSVVADKRTVYCFTVNRGSLTHRVNKESIACRMEVDLKKNQMMRSIGKSEFQVSVTHHLYHAIKYGPAFVWELVKLSISYKYNPLKGTVGWIIDHYKNIKVSKARKRYESE